jgi:hypothetical protein
MASAATRTVEPTLPAVVDAPMVPEPEAAWSVHTEIAAFGGRRPGRSP